MNHGGIGNQVAYPQEKCVELPKNALKFSPPPPEDMPEKLKVQNLHFMRTRSFREYKIVFGG